MAITPEASFQLEQALGVPASFWNGCEMGEYDFSDLGDLVLIGKLHHEMDSEGDFDFAEAILVELGMRYLESLNGDQNEGDHNS